MYNAQLSDKICRTHDFSCDYKCFDARARVFLVLSARMDAETGRYAAPVSEFKEVELRSTAIPQKTCNCLRYKGLE